MCVCGDFLYSCAIAVKSAVVYLFMIAFLPAGDPASTRGKSGNHLFSKWKACSFCPGETAAVPSRSHVQLEGDADASWIRVVSMHAYKIYNIKNVIPNAK